MSASVRTPRKRRAPRQRLSALPDGRLAYRMKRKPPLFFLGSLRPQRAKHAFCLPVNLSSGCIAATQGHRQAGRRGTSSSEFRG